MKYLHPGLIGLLCFAVGGFMLIHFSPARELAPPTVAMCQSVILNDMKAHAKFLSEFRSAETLAEAENYLDVLKPEKPHGR